MRRDQHVRTHVHRRFLLVFVRHLFSEENISGYVAQDFKSRTPLMSPNNQYHSTTVLLGEGALQRQ